MGHPRSKTLNERRVGKINDFKPIIHRISEMVQDRANMLLLIGRHNYMPL